jgi:hypothetical protein
MRKQSFNGKNALGIVLITMVLLISYAVMLKLSGMNVRHSESNLQSNLIRLHRYFFSSVSSQGVLVGSSIGGRLDSQYFRDQGLNIANLGLDGSRPLYSLNLLLTGSKIPKIVIIEGNTIFWEYTGNDAAITKEINSPTFQMGSWFPLLSPDARPSSVLFSILKARKERHGDGMLVEYHEMGSDQEPSLPKNFSQSLEMIRHLKAMGVSVVLVTVPSGTKESDPAAVECLAREAGVPLIKIRDHLPDRGNGLRYSDGMHLMGADAREVVKTLVHRMRTPDLIPKEVCIGSSNSTNPGN